MSDIFENDFKDRKRRFLRGLNRLLGCGISEADFPMRETLRTNLLQFRNNLSNIYCLEFTENELTNMINSGITAREFTEKYCPIVYGDRGKVNLNNLINSSMSDGAIDLREMDKAPKYGMNGGEWCDVAEGPCSCGASH